MRSTSTAQQIVILPYAGVTVQTDATYDAGAGVKSSVVNHLEVYIVSESQRSGVRIDRKERAYQRETRL